MFDWFVSLFSARNPVTYTEEEYKDILFSDNQIKEEEESKAEETLLSRCQHRSGRITTLEPNYGLIDNRYYFEYADLKQKNIKVGETVQYLAYRENENVDWKVKQITIMKADEWQECENSAESALSGEFAVIKKIRTVQIVNRRGRIITMEPGAITCVLDSVESEFDPIEGDWASLCVTVELHDTRENIVDILSIKPLRSRTFEGRVSHVQNERNCGIISSEVFFSNNVCQAGYKASIDDGVVARAIESDQGALTWRALSVLPMDSFITNTDSLSQVKEQRLFDSKKGVLVSSDCDKKTLKIRETTTFKIKVENSGNESQTLVKAELKNSALNNVMTMKKEVTEAVVIPPGSVYQELEVTAKASSSGSYGDILILHFEGGWTIGLMLDMYVDFEDEYRNFLKGGDGKGIEKSTPSTSTNARSNAVRNSRDIKRLEAISKIIPTKQGFIVAGQRPHKPASFLPRSLDQYPIPKNLQLLVYGDGVSLKPMTDVMNSLEQSYHYLTEELKDTNYLDKFHALLYLEELEMGLSIKKYDRDRVSFKREGDYLSLEITNLAESRPSLVVGDKLIASELKVNNAKDDVKYEGCIHKIGYNSIKLKFNEAFQSRYDGKSMSVTFEHSRTNFRRYHQAINEVFKHLGRVWLFPSRLGAVKASLVNVIGEYPPPNRSNEELFCEAEKENIDTNSVVVEKKVTESTPRKKKKTNKITSKKVTLLNLVDSDSENELESSDEEKTNLSEQNGEYDRKETEEKPHDYAKINLPRRSNSKIQWVDESRNAKKKEEESCQRPTRSNIERRDVIVKWINPTLNQYQKAAVRNILQGEARPLPYIIFGPPGTGKTITVVETILQIIFTMPESRILVATPSNSSADLVCERLLSWSLLKAGDLVRLVGYNYMVENRMSVLLKPYCTCIDTKTTDKDTSQITFDNEGVKYSSREVIGRHRVTVSTCAAVGGLFMMGFPKNHFTHIIIDEAGQATEPEIMVPLAFLSEDGQAILAGDPRQLGPVVMSKIALSMGLGDSFLSRLDSRFIYHRDPEGFPNSDGYNPRLVTWLKNNYRSLPNILQLYNDLFYDSELIPKVCPESSPESELLRKVRPCVKDNAWHKVAEVVFHGVKGMDAQDEDSPSWYNNHEIVSVVKYVSQLYAAGLGSKDMGIVTPYQKQAMKLREMLRSMLRSFDVELPKIGTVEEFQGQERNVIIISTVRSNEELVKKDIRHSLGFVSSQQRLNVAISRARSLLIIIGNPYLLGHDSTWKKLIKICKNREFYVGCDLPSFILD